MISSYHFFIVTVLIKAAIKICKDFQFVKYLIILIYIFMSSSGGPKIVDDSLVLYLDAANIKSYPGSGTSITDISLNNNNGLLQNGIEYTAENKGNILFDGSNDYITFPVDFNATTAGLTGYHSVEMWINPETTTGGDKGLFRCNNGSTGRYLHYIIRNGKFHLGWYSIDRGGVQTISPNTWYQVVFMFDTDDRQKIYVNGELDAAGLVLSNNPNLLDGKFFNGGTAPIQIGYYGPFFQGKMSICRVYNKALSASEVMINFNATRNRFGL